MKDRHDQLLIDGKEMNEIKYINNLKFISYSYISFQFILFIFIFHLKSI